jgi:hypothetical protein
LDEIAFKGNYMKLSRRISQNLDSKLVQRTNEIYHNLENAYYDERHDEILISERVYLRADLDDTYSGCR